MEKVTYLLFNNNLFGVIIILYKNKENTKGGIAADYMNFRVQMKWQQTAQRKIDWNFDRDMADGPILGLLIECAGTLLSGSTLL